MKFTHRVRRLESVMRPEPSCPGCGYPQRAQIRVILTEHDDPLPTCTVCRRPLDEEGAPIHTPYTRIILPPELN